MMNSIGVILTVITLAINVPTCLISLVILIFVIYKIFYSHLKQDDKVVVSLCAHIYFLIFSFTAISLSFNIETILGDLYEKDFNSLWCIFAGYFVPVIFGALFWALVNQALFRLCRIVYATHRFLQHLRIYLILPPIEFILICTLLCPLLFWHDISYLPKEHYCYVPNTNIRAMVWLVVSAYGIPLLCLLLVYLRITIFLRREFHNQTLLVKQRQQKDLLVIRRILFIVSVLLGFGTPDTVLLIMAYITGKEHPLMTRIVWLSISISMMILSLSLIILTPQLKSMILKKLQHIRVDPNEAPATVSILMRHHPNTL